MKRNFKHYSAEATHTTNKHTKTGSHDVNGEEYLFNSETYGDGKNRKRYDRNEQKRLYLHRLH
jgi:hypothetical protein